MYIIIYETDLQSRFGARDRVLRAVHDDDPERWDGGQVGGRIRMGSACDSREIMAKSTTIMKSN